MALKAVFIGVNKHVDANIPELTGARRDATALWALFTDTFYEDMAGQLLVDETARHADVRQAVLGILATAILLSFVVAFKYRYVSEPLYGTA